MIMRHEKRKLPEAVAHLTSPGFVGGRSRQELGLRGGGPHRLITDMAVLGSIRRPTPLRWFRCTPWFAWKMSWRIRAFLCISPGGSADSSSFRGRASLVAGRDRS